MGTLNHTRYDNYVWLIQVLTQPQILSLEMLVLDSRDKQGKVWLPPEICQNNRPHSIAYTPNTSYQSNNTRVINTINLF